MRNETPMQEEDTQGVGAGRWVRPHTARPSNQCVPTYLECGCSGGWLCGVGVEEEVCVQGVAAHRKVQDAVVTNVAKQDGGDVAKLVAPWVLSVQHNHLRRGGAGCVGGIDWVLVVSEQGQEDEAERRSVCVL